MNHSKFVDNEDKNKRRKKILFVCLDNSYVSQVAVAFANTYSKDKIDAYSAGSRLSDQSSSNAIKLMEEIGYDLSKHSSKSLKDLPMTWFDMAVSIGHGRAQEVFSLIRAKKYIEWNIPNPKDMDMENFRKIRDLIEQKVKELIKVLPTHV